MMPLPCDTSSFPPLPARSLPLSLPRSSAGEDVVHGGYYLVTDGLASKYPQRVRDFPPDETSLIGAGMGFAQVRVLRPVSHASRTGC